ncbi:MAG: trehalose-6-phosphate synthase [Elusimicrobiales bacterium]|nr:trehalose-6-phosphate synthase [Elusimicrobiales bacterium]
MRITFRLISSLIVVVVFVALVSAWFNVRQERGKLYEEVRAQSALLAESFKEGVRHNLEIKNRPGLQKLADKFQNQKNLVGVAIYDSDGGLISGSSSLPAELLARAPEINALISGGDGSYSPYAVGEKKLFLFPLNLTFNETEKARIVLFTNVSYIEYDLFKIWKRTLIRLLAQMILISLVTLLIIRWNLVDPITQMAEWMKNLRIGDAHGHAPPIKGDIFAPIAREATTLATNLQAARRAAENEARLRQKGESLWTPERLKEHIKIKMDGRPLFVVSNREPYMHIKEGKDIRAIVPAGGLVTALDPIMKAAGGTWVAHGSGEADFEVTDAANRIKVPPEEPAYNLRRVALSKEEEDGYYYGFSNEGIWPLCHIAHIRPIFRKEDWKYYYEVNEKFCKAVLEEIEGVKEPCVLIQDYHFTLLPGMIKAARPDARVAVFWHIPWPNPETFGICPWQKELVMGLLGADLIGFQTQFYCNNFLDTVDRTIESRIDWEHFSVQKEGHTTMVKPFPISVDFQQPDRDAKALAQKPEAGAVLKELGIKAEKIAVGVDRIDYTKGMLERVKAVERFLEKYPAYQGKFTFIQLGAPSRTHIPQYHRFLAELHAEVDRINWRFKAKDWKAIVFLEKHHAHKEITKFYKIADACLVTSLHDGMNLVAKEFVAASDDHRGVLILSRFAGASRELKDALIVNPYDIEQMADAIYYSLIMPKTEVEERMTRMRQDLHENNIYKWAANLTEELIKLRMDDFKLTGS